MHKISQNTEELHESQIKTAKSKNNKKIIQKHLSIIH
jgi:hypothetical protein